jgi:hypothetical protein
MKSKIHGPKIYKGMEVRNKLKKIRLLLGMFTVLLLISGLTAFPIVTEMGWLRNMFPDRSTAMGNWVGQVYDGVMEVDHNYPYIFYGTDWLAFAHIVIATAFIGPLRDPVRNIWVIQFGMIACVMVFPLALICTPLRHLPFWWSFIDCSFGLFGIIPLAIAYRLTRQLSSTSNVTAQ